MLSETGRLLTFEAAIVIVTFDYDCDVSAVSNTMWDARVLNKRLYSLKSLSCV